MISQQSISIVKATAPILAVHAETLTRHFYKRMFAGNPEVIPFFNAAHQVSGAQQKALAGAICAYAANIDNLGALGEAVELIAQKHASLQIKPEHYPIVGKHLLASIREVLGEGATEEVIAAWAEAYGLLADILIGREGQIYQTQSSSPSGWAGFKSFKVIKKVKESDVITSFYLAPATGEALPAFKPGQYITVRVPTAQGSTTMRNYSLSDKPGKGYFRISVKREKGQVPGYVSNKLHDAIEVGAMLDVAPPCGEFVLDTLPNETRPLVLLGGGVGVTPLISMLYAALEAQPERHITFVHACLHEKVQAFREKLDELATQYPHLKVLHCYSEPAPAGIVRSSYALNGYINRSLLTSCVKEKESDYYICGPKAFMVNVYQQLLDLGVPAKQVHYEFFGPRESMEAKLETLVLEA